MLAGDIDDIGDKHEYDEKKVSAQLKLGLSMMKCACSGDIVDDDTCNVQCTYILSDQKVPGKNYNYRCIFIVYMIKRCILFIVYVKGAGRGGVGERGGLVGACRGTWRCSCLAEKVPSIG